MKTPFSRIRDFSYFQLWRESWPYAGPRERRTIILYHAMYIVAVAGQLLQPFLFGKLVNTLQKGGPTLFHDSLQVLGLIVSTTFLNWSFHGPGRVMEMNTAKKVHIAYTEHCYKCLTEMPLNWHQDHHSGSIINRIHTAGESLREFIGNSFSSFQNFWMLLGSIGALLWFNPIVGALSLFGFLLSMVVVVLMNKRLVAAVHAHNEVMHQANATFYDFVSNMTSIVILRLQKFSQSSLGARLIQAYPFWRKQVLTNEWRWFIYSMFNTSMTALILLGYIKAQLTLHGTIAAGSLVTVYLYQDKIGNQGFGFLGIHGQWLRQLTNMLATKGILEDHSKLVKLHPQAPAPDWKQINIRNLLFNYRMDGGAAKTVLNNINLSIRHGERIALIGDSGAGKSTLLTLLRALHTPQHADVSVDGKHAEFDTLSEITTLIPQDPEIFENTIRFNVNFDLGVPDDLVYKAIDLAEFTAVLKQLPKGLDADIREKGVNLSVGQKQRLALARGIFAAEQSDIILLDEPTSSVDLPTEERIFNNILSHFKGKTVIATLHRLHLLPKFDRIVYLSAGHVLADLPVQEALSTPGPIRDLYVTYQQQKIA